MTLEQAKAELFYLEMEEYAYTYHYNEIKRLKALIKELEREEQK